MELLDLDDYSLTKIFSYCSIEDLLKLSDISGRFRKLCQPRTGLLISPCMRKFELDYRTIMLSKEDRHVESIFRMFGSSMESFRFSAGIGRIVDERLRTCVVYYLNWYCKSLRHLTINFVPLPKWYLTILAGPLHTLVSLDLAYCDLADDSLGEILPSRTLQLRTLAIPGNQYLTGAFLANWTDCPKLELLDLRYCPALKNDMIDQFLQEHFKKHSKRVIVVVDSGRIWSPRNKDIVPKEDRSIALRTESPELK
ncbi:hypothetical protein ZHAS_00014146 [Anopheles sinensis]|uniref:F-box domain-containing protein n=1 Tax=Anopheles sinensis TaxID=74873 RepID=A0A084W7D6_ANOSI|nr:hypothetical protein ZHAS_00014146 [Anopheles sinensis]